MTGWSVPALAPSLPESRWCESRGRRPERAQAATDSLFSSAWAGCGCRGMYGMEQCHLQTQRGKGTRCQPAEPVVICTHLCLRTSCEPPESGVLYLARQKWYQAQGRHRYVCVCVCGGGLISLPRELYSHKVGDGAAKDILGCDTGCGRVLSVIRFRGWCPPQC